MAEVTITRTLFRTGDSEYAINGTPCRLLDIQELLSDSGVGRQQHMIIGQGQLDTVLNARPEDRRAIIEEAAGVLKHRRRRERAERRLASAQENLERLGDLVREAAASDPTARTPSGGRPHPRRPGRGAPGRAPPSGRDRAGLPRRAAADQPRPRCRCSAEREEALGRELAELDAAAVATAAELSSRRQEDLAASLGRVQGLSERVRGTLGVLRERTRGVAAALDAAADIDVVSTLEAEGARLADELAAAEAEAVDLRPEAEDLAVEEQRLDADHGPEDQEVGEPASLAEAEEALRRARTGIELLRRAETEPGPGPPDPAGARRSPSSNDWRRSTSPPGRRTDGRRPSRPRPSGWPGGRGGRRASPRARRRVSEPPKRRPREPSSDGTAPAPGPRPWREPSPSLEGAGGRALLTDVVGVVGALVDLVDIDPGWEAAFEGAVGAGLGAVVVDGRTSARAALRRLVDEKATGALLAARPGPAASATAPGDLPAGAEPLRPHVRVRPGSWAGVEGVLDWLLGPAVRVSGWEAAADLSLDRGDLVVVTADGDRFAAAGWRLRAAHAVVTRGRRGERPGRGGRGRVDRRAERGRASGRPGVAGGDPPAGRHRLAGP